MKDDTYKALLRDLQKLQKSLVTSQVEAVRRDPILTARLARLHSEAEVGGHLDTFVATAARKSAVLFLLRTVFVRVLEDLGILGLKRIRDDWGFAAFREVAPALGIRAYFSFVFRDLAIDFPGLFAASEDELPLPSEDNCRDLWNLWHHPNRDGELYIWNGEGFDSRFLGDLYQDLDADIRKRYALLQTPKFVEQYILERTLVPALREFDPAALSQTGQTFRLLDPTCGSGHFLIGAFHQMADYWRDTHGHTEWDACAKSLDTVWGCDINPHAIEIAEFRLLLEVVARTGVKALDQLATLHFNLRAMDSLIPWERSVKQGELFPAKDRLDAYATSAMRRENATFLDRAFHVVVGNPPYITPKDTGKRDDYRAFWPDSAAGKYALSAPFVERFFDMAHGPAFVGQITANSFMKRAFGKRLVKEALPRWCLTDVVDCSGTNVSGHGTPTVILIGKATPPTTGSTVRMILGKRGDPRGAGVGPASPVWREICSAPDEAFDGGSFVTVVRVDRDHLKRHPWSIGGGGLTELKRQIEAAASEVLGSRGRRIGLLTKLIEDDPYLPAPSWLTRYEATHVVPFVTGSSVRDWAVESAPRILFPYDDQPPFSVQHLESTDRILRYLWPFKQQLWRRRSRATGFAPLHTIADAEFYEYPFYYPEGLTHKVITFPYLATHAHFATSLGRLHKEKAPLILLPPGAERGLPDILGLLNTSTLQLWMKQVFQNRGYSATAEGGRATAEAWDDFYEQDPTKLKQAPLCARDTAPRSALADALDAAALERAQCLPSAILANAWSPGALAAELDSARERYLTITRRLVALQEELDWLTYSSYELAEPVVTVEPADVEPLAPGHRPFEILLARQDEDAEDEEKSAWWSRHGHDRVTEVPESYSASHRARLQERLEAIGSDWRLALLETPVFKRRWQLVDWGTEVKKAAETWLLEKLEDLFAPATSVSAAGPLAQPRPYRLEEINAAWSRDPRVAEVAGVWAGTGLSVDLSLVSERLLRSNALPDNPYRLFSADGIRKLAEWKQVWAQQDKEDADVRSAEARRAPVTPQARDAIPAPTKFEKADFARSEFFSIRGKLNTPRERFISFIDLSPNRYGWNGWRDRDRALAQAEAFTLAESDPQQPLPLPTSEDPRRCGVTLGLWESLEDVRRWGTSEEHAELQALAREACRQPRCPCPVVETWKTRSRDGETATEARKPKKRLQIAPTVSLAQRAWVASLFQAGRELDLAGVWARHLSRLSEPSQASLPGVTKAPIQLTMPVLRDDGAAEHASLEQTTLALVLDDLVASGDLQPAGRGKKKRFQLVVRGGAS